jgi:hypothetical protein
MSVLHQLRSKYLGTLICLLGLASGPLFAQNATLKNHDMTAVFAALPQFPRLVNVIAADGRVWKNAGEESLPGSIEINGASVALKWALKPELTVQEARAIEYVYEAGAPHLRLHWRWESRADFGPLEHKITIENLSGHELWLPLIDSLQLELGIGDGFRHFTVEKGADSPSAEGLHDAEMSKGFEWIGRSSTYARPMPGEAREIIPIEIVYDSKTTAQGWYAGLEFSGRTRIWIKRVDEPLGIKVQTRLGLNPDPGPYRTRLSAGESFETPVAFFGSFNGGPDGAGNQLRPWVRAVLGNPKTWADPQYPLLVNNSWGSGMQVDEALALRMIGDSKELGLEMFHMDAGWFRGVGDWYPSATKFPHGLGVIADAAHKAGLRFGLWVDWAQAGVDTDAGALNVQKVQPWLSHDVAADWKPEEFKGQTIDLGVPAAREYAAGELKRIVESYHLDMLEHDGYLVMEGCLRTDHPHAPPVQSTARMDHDSGFDFVVASNSTDVSDHAVRAYYKIYEQLRSEHPGLLFEICNDGGRMMDFGSAAHGDYFSITDTYDPLSNRRAFFDTSYVLPAAMLESYVEKWPTPRIENFRYMLRSGMMGWMTVMLDTTAWTKEQHETAQAAISLYKEKLRPLIRDAEIYHVSARPDGVHWDGVEYWDAKRAKGVVFAFRGSTLDESTHRFQLEGVTANARYKLHFEDGSSPDREVSGTELMGAGLTVDLTQPNSSELVFIDAGGQHDGSK